MCVWFLLQNALEHVAVSLRFFRGRVLNVYICLCVVSHKLSIFINVAPLTFQCDGLLSWNFSSCLILFTQWKLTACLMGFIGLCSGVFEDECVSIFDDKIINACAKIVWGREMFFFVLIIYWVTWINLESVLSKPFIIPKLLPMPPTPPMLKPNFRSFCTTEWCRCPLEFWFTMCECWSWWCDCLLLLCCCWADLISWFFIFSCSSRSRRA